MPARVFAIAVRWLLGAALCAGALSAHAYEGVYGAEAVKAAFLYRFAGYVEWPQGAAGPERFTIAVLGAEAVATALSELVAARRVHGLPVQVRRIGAAGEAQGAQILYVGPDYPGELRPLLDALAGRALLTVTDRPGALDEGSVINFLLVDRRLRFEVALPAAARAGLRIAPELLSVAASVRGVPRSDRGCSALPPPLLDAPCRALRGRS